MGSGKLGTSPYNSSRLTRTMETSSESDLPRTATESDIAAMIEIWSQANCRNSSFLKSPKEAQERFRANFKGVQEPFSFWVVASPALLAWSSLLPAFTHPLKQSSEAEISLYVAPDCSGEGIGSELMKFTLDKAHRSGIERVWGFALRENRASIRMCEKAGMTICGSSREKLILLSENSG